MKYLILLILIFFTGCNFHVSKNHIDFMQKCFKEGGKPIIIAIGKGDIECKYKSNYFKSN